MLLAGAGVVAADRADGFTIPLRLGEMLVSLDKVEYREEILTVKEPRAATDNLFKLDHRIDGAHQHDVPHALRVDAR